MKKKNSLVLNRNNRNIKTKTAHVTDVNELYETEWKISYAICLLPPVFQIWCFHYIISNFPPVSLLTLHIFIYWMFLMTETEYLRAFYVIFLSALGFPLSFRHGANINLPLNMHPLSHDNRWNFLKELNILSRCLSQTINLHEFL